MRVGTGLGCLGLVLALVACGSDDADVEDDDSGPSGSGGMTAGPSGSGGMATTTSSTGGSGGMGQGGDAEAAEVCARWNADRADLSEGTWSGAIAGCMAGDTSMAGRDNALKLINLYRWLSDLPAVTHDATRNAKAQECALMMHANNDLDHYPPMSWDCWNADGDEAAERSNIATTPGVRAVDLYMADPGNATTIGHRRWILNNRLGPVGLGSTDGYSCMWVVGGNGNGGRDWTAFPAEGVWPIEAMSASFASVDDTGWTIQSEDINLEAGTVTVTEDGVEVPVTVDVLQRNIGSKYAIKLTPQGWTSQAGSVYEVSVTDVSMPFSYEVRMVSCE